MKPPAEMNPIPEESIDAMAAAWLVQREEGFDADQAAAFACWRQADPRHEAAVQRLDETCGILNTLPRLREHLRYREMLAERGKLRVPPVARFPVRRLAFALAASLTLLLAGWWFGWPRPFAVETYSTTVGGYQRITLRDNSVIELNANSKVRVQFNRQYREIFLLEGEGHFSVAKNKDWPFVVNVGLVAVRAVGTAFNIRRGNHEVEVLVTEGVVRVTRTGVQADPEKRLYLDYGTKGVGTTEELRAGQRAEFGLDADLAGARIENVDATAIQEALDWQAPRFVFVETPLAHVVGKFNQRNRLQLMVQDPRLAARPVDGSFRADSVELFVSLLERSGDITAERIDDDHIVLHRAKPR